MSLANYAALQESVANWLNTPDLIAMIPDFIRLAEADLQRRVVHQQGMSDRAALTVTAGAVDLPADFNGVISAKGQCKLTFVPMDVYYSYADASGIPVEYTLIGDQMVLYPAPADGTVITLAYKIKLGLLATGSNWVFEKHPDAYLFGALAQASDDPRCVKWGARFDEIIRSIELDGIRLSTGGSLQLRSNGT